MDTSEKKRAFLLRECVRSGHRTSRQRSFERRERHMEAVLQNLESTVELLAVVQTERVKEWDKQTLERAFQWTRYCEHLYSRFHTNSAIRNVMERQLQVTNQRLRTAFEGYTEVTFLDLSVCQHLLMVKLLNNPTLPGFIIETLFSANSPLKTNGEQPQGPSGHCDLLVEYKSACKVLGIKNARPASALGPDAEVQGLLLVERLDALLCHGNQGTHAAASTAEQFLDSVLQALEGEDHICFVIAAALVTKKDNSVTDIASRDFLIGWLQKKHSLVQTFCATVPTRILKDIAQQNTKFRTVYSNMLKKWTSDMEFDINKGEWIHACSQIRLSFKMLTKHFLSLFEACPLLREDLFKELNDQKVSDGDFDERGLSVWGDLLSELTK